MDLAKNKLKLISLICLCSSMAWLGNAHAEDLYTTDDYLKGLSDEASSPEYLEKAKQDLLATEKRELSQGYSDGEIQQALSSMYDFETLIRTRHPSSHAIYSKLPASARVLIYDKFKSTKKLSAAKRMIINKYEIK